jgi:hypothetical protein
MQEPITKHETEGLLSLFESQSQQLWVAEVLSEVSRVVSAEPQSVEDGIGKSFLR